MPRFRTALTALRDQGDVQPAHTGGAMLLVSPVTILVTDHIPTGRPVILVPTPHWPLRILNIILVRTQNSIERFMSGKTNTLGHCRMALSHEPQAVTDVFIFQSRDLGSKVYALPKVIRR